MTFKFWTGLSHKTDNLVTEIYRFTTSIEKVIEYSDFML